MVSCQTLIHLKNLHQEGLDELPRPGFRRLVFECEKFSSVMRGYLGQNTLKEVFLQVLQHA